MPHQLPECKASNVITEISARVANEAQRAPRTNLFVMAAIYADAGSTPVKVRNVSPGGALIESAVVPPIGSQVRLCRGNLSVSAQIVWSRDGRAGLRFQSTVSVADWLPRSLATHPQQRVDEMVQTVKATERVPTSSSDCLKLGSSSPTALELTQLTEAIESLAEDLAADTEVVKRHLLKLQSLDLAAQALRKLAASVDDTWPPSTEKYRLQT